MVDKHAERIDKNLKIQAEKLNFKDLEFPIKVIDIKKFERQNNISVNVIEYVDKRFSILKNVDDKKDIHVNLLLKSDKEKYHYTLIKSMSRLFSKEVSKHNDKKYFCDRCLNFFGSEDTLKEHIRLCKNVNEPGIPTMSIKGEDDHLYFKNNNREMKVPFVLYADFESSLINLNNSIGDSTQQYQKHKSNSYCILVKGFDENIYKTKIVKYRAKDDQEDIGLRFVNDVENIVREIYNIESNKK